MNLKKKFLSLISSISYTPQSEVYRLCSLVIIFDIEKTVWDKLLVTKNMRTPIVTEYGVFGIRSLKSKI